MNIIRGYYITTVMNSKKSNGKFEDVSYIYVLTNPAWNGWCKIGKANKPHKRLSTYNTGSPLRDYKIHFQWFVKHPDLYEKEFKKIFKTSHEWHEIHPDAARDIIMDIYRRFYKPSAEAIDNVAMAKGIIDKNRANMKDHRTDFDCIAK